jgi:hypothetical protein
LETQGNKLQGVWASVAISATFVAGAAGLILGALAYIGG